MAMLGWWDGELRPDGWFDAELQPAGWWDTEIVDTTVGGGAVVCNLSVTDSADTLAAGATVEIVATLAITDAADSLASGAGVVDLENLNTTDSADTGAGVALVLIAGNLSISDSSDSLSSGASLEASEEPEVISLGGRNKLLNTPTNRVKAESSASDESDSLQAVASVAVQRNVEFSVVDYSDSLTAESIGAWAQAQLIINRARLLRAPQVRLVSSRAEETA